jgi:hypothetical protein
MRASGAARAWQERLLFSCDLEKSKVQDPRLRLGAELWLMPRSLAVRMGWNQGQWTAGAGWRTPLFAKTVDAGLDYALAGDPLGDGALQHRISLDLGMSLD